MGTVLVGSRQFNNKSGITLKVLRVQEAGREEGVLLPLPKGSFFFLLETLCTYCIILYSRGSCGLFGGRTPPPRKCACPCSAPCCHNPSGDMSSVQTKCRWSLALGGAPPNPHLLGHFLGSQGPHPSRPCQVCM